MSLDIELTIILTRSTKFIKAVGIVSVKKNAAFATANFRYPGSVTEKKSGSVFTKNNFTLLKTSGIVSVKKGIALNSTK